jgi:hypothetical protein
LTTLRREAKAWNRRMQRDRIKIAWKFDRQAARRKFGYNRKSFKRSKTWHQSCRGRRGNDKSRWHSVKGMA